MHGDQYRLENWEVLGGRAPGELGPAYLAGRCYGHSRFADGTQVYTTPVVGAHKELIVTRSGSRIELGTPHPEYEKRFPNARERVIEEGKKHQIEADNAKC